MKVIEIVDESTVIVDYGYDSGAKPGKKLRIYVQGEPVYNLDGTDLGNVDLIKDTITVVTVYEKFSICKKEKLIKREILNPLAALLQDTVIREPLSTDEECFSHRKYISEEPVAVGDLVMEIPE